MGWMKTICTVEDCDTFAWSGFKGMCPKHHSRWQRTGDPTGLVGRYGPKPTPPYERIMRRAVRDGECLRYSNQATYPHISNGQRGGTTGHRVVWEHHNGPIPDGLFVCHTCDNRWCVEIAHLWLGTHADNMRDMALKGRGRKARAS